MIERIALPLAISFFFATFSAAQQPASESSATLTATTSGPAPTVEPAPAPEPAKAPKPRPRRKSPPAKPIKKGPQEPPSSKYKTRLLTDNTDATYRFDAYGNPIKPGVKKTMTPVGVGTPHQESADPRGSGRKACSAAEPCAGKSSDPEAL